MVNVYFFDASALVKRYIIEIGSEWVQEITDPQTGSKIVVARISWVELLSAFSRLRREGRLQEATLQNGISTLSRHFRSEYQVGELTIPITEMAGELLQRNPLRAYDAVQLATALEIHPKLSSIEAASYNFVSADRRLLTIAQAEGLSVLDPLRLAQDK